MAEWNRILLEEVYSREEPDESIVAFLGSFRSTKKNARGLDLACGAGRHAVYMARLGFETHGADIALAGLRLTRDRLKKQNLHGYLVKCDMKHLPYTGSCFDVVICFHAVYHQKLKEIQESLSEIHRVLRKEGVTIANFLSKRTYSYAKGSQIEENTFMEEEGSEKGVLHHFTDKEELEQLFAIFKTTSIDLHEKEVEGKLRSRWIVNATV